MALSEAEELELLQLQKSKAMASQPAAQPSNGTFLENAGHTIQSDLDKIAPAIGVAQKLQGIVTPGSGIPELAQSAGQSILDKLGGLAAEYGGRKGLNPYASGALGMGISNLPALAIGGPEEKLGGTLFPAETATERLPAVSAMEQIGGPVSRAERTGGKLATGIENLLEKTVLGSGPSDARKVAQQAALQAEKTRLQESLGGTQDIFSAGLKGQAAIPQRAEAMSAQRQAMFDAIPDDVHIPLSKYQKMGDTLIDEQSKIRPLARDADITKFAQDAQSPYGSTGAGVTGGPDVQGVTVEKPGKKIPASSVQKTSNLIDEKGRPIQYQENIPGKTIPGSKIFGTQTSAEPEETFEPKANYFDLKALRETLNGKIQESHNAGNFQKERNFLRLKQALDSDIESFAGSPTTPLDSLTANEFKQTYQKANAFSGAFKGLFKSDEAKALPNLPPEKVVPTLFRPNNETAIKQYRALAGESGFSQAKQVFTQQLLESPNVNKELDKLKGSASAIFSPKELIQLRRYGSAQSVPKAVANLQGTQGSARSNIAAAQWGALASGLGGGATAAAFGHPLAGAAQAGGAVGQFVAPALLSKVYEAASGGIPISISSKIPVKTTLGLQGLNVVGRNDQLRQALQQILQKIQRKPQSAGNP